MFFEFDQNNSFGKFDIDHKRGISTFVIVEADDFEEANYRAGRIGLYFDGQGDCPCCGNRWGKKCEYDDGDEHPEHWGQDVSDHLYRSRYHGIGTDETRIVGYIHFKDKPFEPVFAWVVDDNEE